MDNVELSRRLENLIRIGTVAAVDHGAALCRVESGGLVTDWLPWIAPRAGTTREWNPPTPGEQVMILSPSGEPGGGVVLTGVFSAAAPAPSQSPHEHLVIYRDGARICYDHAAGHLSATGIQTALIEASASITLNTPLTHCTGRLDVDGLITYHDGLAGEGGAHGNAIHGPITHSDGNLSSNGVVLHTHTHVDPQGGSTGAPS